MNKPDHNGSEQTDSMQNQRGETLEKRMLPRPGTFKNDEHIVFEDLFNIENIQRLQDEFSGATGVASIITHPDGTPITSPSNFCRLCRDIIRKTDKGRANCFKSDAVIGQLKPEGPTVQRCMSGGLWDAGAGITVGGKHIANWLIGQVRDESQSEDQMRGYARKIGANEKDIVEAFREVPAMSRKQFERIAGFLFTLANQLSTTAYQNLQQARSIAEREQIEQALTESEERFRYFSDASQEAIFFLKKGFILDVNQVTPELFGYDARSDFIGKFGTEFVAPESRNIVKSNILSDSFEPYEAVGMRKDGTRFPISIRAKAMPYRGEGIVRATSVTDITRRRETEEALKESEKQFRSTLNNIQIGVVVHGSDSQILFSNPEASFILGLTYEQMAGKEAIDPAWNFVSEDLSVMPVEDYPVSRVLSTKQAVPDSIVGIKKPGRKELTWVIANAIPVLSDGGDVEKVIVNFVDFTKHKRAEEKLRRNESLLTDTQRLAKIGGWEVDLEKQITYWTDEVYRMHDMEPDEFPTIDDAVRLSINCYEPEDRPLVLEAYKKCVETGLAYDHEFPFTTTKGRRLWVRTIANPVMKDGTVVKVVGNFMDVTELKQAEEERGKLETQLRQAQKMESIGTLAGGIAHDFNNILSPIMGYTEMLLDDIPEDSPQRAILEPIFSGAMRARDLVKQILTFSRQESTEFKLMKIQPILLEAMKLIRSTIPATIKIRQDIRNDCGIIKANPTEIHQIVMNLATNAYHAMEESGGELTVKLKEVTFGEDDVTGLDLVPGTYICLTIADTGIGMDKTTLDKAFDPFFTTKKRGKGTGMGLSVIHGIIKNTGGSINAYSEIGQGTVFYVYLPVVESTAKHNDFQIREEVSGGTEHILIVDDENAVLTMETQMLERLGYQIVSCNSSLEALETFRNAPDKFDLVITDMAMPNMSGDKLSSELIKLRPDIPILLCTGFSEQIPESKALAMGIKGLLMKPVIRADLSRKIREILDD